jgi:hypothetical protein
VTTRGKIGQVETITLEKNVEKIEQAFAISRPKAL